eukprot:jgi/Ulvmu1/5993/UM026_0117.1
MRRRCHSMAARVGSRATAHTEDNYLKIAWQPPGSLDSCRRAAGMARRCRQRVLAPRSPKEQSQAAQRNPPDTDHAQQPRSATWLRVCLLPLSQPTGRNGPATSGYAADAAVAR